MNNHLQTSTGNQGFTLIEVLVAIVILSIGIIALTSMQTAGIKGNATANILTVGGNWGATKIEQIFAMDYDELENGSSTSANGNYQITWTVTEDYPMPDTKSVDISVSGKDGNENRSVDITYIKARYVK